MKSDLKQIFLYYTFQVDFILKYSLEAYFNHFYFYNSAYILA